jgi:hypothetical protein
MSRVGTRVDSSGMPLLESPPDSSTRQTPRTLSDEDHGTRDSSRRQTCPRSKVRPTRRLVRLLACKKKLTCRRRVAPAPSDSSDTPPRSKVRPTRRLVRLVDSSDSSIFSRMFWVSFGSPGDRIRTAYLLGKFDQSDAARFKCVSGRPGCWFPGPPPPPPPHLTTRLLGLAAQESWMQPEHWSKGGAATFG